MDSATSKSAEDDAEPGLHNFHARLPLLSAKSRDACNFSRTFCLSLTFNSINLAAESVLNL